MPLFPHARLSMCLLALGGSLALAQTQSASGAPAPPPPTADQLQSALDQVKPGGARIGEFLGCVPAFRQPAGVRLCALKPGGSDSLQTIPFRFAKGRWDVVLDRTRTPPAINGACPPLDVAQAAFRRLRGDASLRIIGEVDVGESIVTDERGVRRDRKGPYRLICRYDVATGLGAKQLFISYVWHDGSRYVVDPDIEIWPDD